MNQVSNSENLSPSLTSSDMNQTHNSETHPSSLSSLSNTQDNNVLTISNSNVIHSTTAVQNIHPQYANTQTLPQQILQTTLTPIPFHPTIFFYRPPNDFCHYYVNCKEICHDTVTYLLNKSLKENNVQYENKCIFYYRQQYNARFYQVSCEIVSPLLINSCLNKNFLGIEFQQNTENEKLAFAFEQKENLEDCLKQYLSQYLLK
ncbi:hypothetical protein RclHR1_00920009 [Rhizophagus clarus]|uniref:Uncharacterized protein n=1 Tax=Rhizophagus clarus TaxID=94130 RepID=A0A2Z6S5U1_9GLOM|nr:hypothetical protein RclHR1_00920009 [Rhizophagus clarus]GES73803.1 hypothetical protein GLOIN_2v1828169 [Rhizophagus clarus]